MRALKKWRGSNTIISELIAMQNKGRKTTWSSRGYIWIRRYLKLTSLNLNMSDQKTIKKDLKNIFQSRKVTTARPVV